MLTVPCRKKLSGKRGALLHDTVVFRHRFFVMLSPVEGFFTSFS